MNALLGITPRQIEAASVDRPPLPRPQGKPEDYTLIPESWRVVVSSVLYAACNLAIDYAGTITDECARLKLPFKSQCRNVKTLVDSYLRPRQYIINGQAMENETNLGLGIEEACKPHLNAVNITVQNTATRQGKTELKYLWSAVAQCMVATAAMMSYSYLLDTKVKSLFQIPVPSDNMFLPRQLEMLHKYISVFVPKDDWTLLTPHIREAAKVMTETLVGCEVYGCELMREQKFRKWTNAEVRFANLDTGGRFTTAQKALCIGRSEKAFLNKIKELTKQKQQKK